MDPHVHGTVAKMSVYTGSPANLIVLLEKSFIYHEEHEVFSCTVRAVKEKVRQQILIAILFDIYK